MLNVHDHIRNRLPSEGGNEEDLVKPNARNIAARILARHLTLSLNIRQGRELVPLLGTTGRESDNLEVLTAWIHDRISDLDQWPIPGAQALHLANVLEKELKGIMRDADGS